mmetsp:Transcript_37582/g.27707  ORF Transcript_37582/g.27707 Transcript_37582/m.27707 type:complete len:94 (+) Transcript_37582:53-334(+)
MISATERDARLSHMPYIDNIPFFFNPMQRQCRDMMAAIVLTGFMFTPVSGFVIASMRYGQYKTYRRMLWCGLQFGASYASFGLVQVWFFCPQC